jgi:hypothetical protein
MAPAALLFEPAPVMPMSPQIRLVLGDDDQVEGARFNEAVAARARIPFTRGVWLDGRDDLV